MAIFFIHPVHTSSCQVSSHSKIHVASHRLSALMWPSSLCKLYLFVVSNLGGLLFLLAQVAYLTEILTCWNSDMLDCCFDGMLICCIVALLECWNADKLEWYWQGGGCNIEGNDDNSNYLAILVRKMVTALLRMNLIIARWLTII